MLQLLWPSVASQLSRHCTSTFLRQWMFPIRTCCNNIYACIWLLPWWVYFPFKTPIKDRSADLCCKKMGNVCRGATHRDLKIDYFHPSFANFQIRNSSQFFRECSRLFSWVCLLSKARSVPSVFQLVPKKQEAPFTCFSNLSMWQRQVGSASKSCGSFIND